LKLRECRDPGDDNGERSFLSNCNIQLWDTWGVDEKNYKSNFLLELLNGQIPDGFKMESVNVSGSDPERKSTEEEKASRMHGVFLFVPIGILGDNAFCSRVKEILTDINRMGINAILIVTRADSVDDPVSLQKEIAEAFALPPYRVYMVSNYVDAKQKDFQIDKRTLYVFWDALKGAHTFWELFCSPKTLSQAVSTPRIPRVWLCEAGSPKEDAKGIIRSVDGSSAVSAFKERIVLELGDEYSQVSFPGSQSDSQAIAMLLVDGVLTISLRKEAKEAKILVVRDNTTVGIIQRVPRSTKLIDLRARIVDELELTSFAFCDEGIRISSRQEGIYTVEDIVKNGEVIIK